MPHARVSSCFRTFEDIHSILRIANNHLRINIQEEIIVMPVPRRRNPKGGSLALSPKVIMSTIFDIDYIFKRSRTLLYYTFAPAVIYYGMTTEPAPASWLELINIF
mmetsp:Transcript_10859/g.31582  ORF Transcript_10859/g.31582 Transcript_10859/m.31582 type:complete len:106 (+) Transcript_10859:33-350(+)